MESRAVAPPASYAVGMHVRLHGLSRAELNEIVGVVVEDKAALARGRVAVRVPCSENPLAVKPENLSRAADAAVLAREKKGAAVSVAQVAVPSSRALQQQKVVAQHPDESSENDTEEEADADELDLLLRREEHLNIVKAYPDTKNIGQLIVCYVCGTSSEHRSRKKAFYYLTQLHFTPNGSQHKFGREIRGASRNPTRS